jgi:site-specific DNA-cytosine methylase
MNTLRQAMENQQINVDKYYSSEIKPYAIKLTQHHFPDTIQLGDIAMWREWDIDWATIDFIGSGSPCQDLSIAGKRAGIQGERSSLFFTFIEILNHIRKLNPNVLFLQENVGSANVVDIGIMSRELGVYPVLINSNLVTAQNRSRYYWTNIRTKEYGMFGDIVTDIPQPKDRKIFLKDIIESGEVDTKKSITIMESDAKRYAFSDKDKMYRYIKNKINKNAQIATFVYENGYYRKLSQTELERLQGFPDGYTSILSYNQAASVLGDGWTLPVIEHILSFINTNQQ